MATDFFERQAAARRATGWLVAGFACATAGIAAVVFGAVYLAIDAQATPQRDATAQPTWQIAAAAAAGATVLIALGSLYKVVALRAGGGSGVAEGLGGRRVSPDTSDPTERRLLNVTEEMALASGTPTPPVFLLDEPGVNAFAAGYSASDAVIGVTRGCAEGLSRDELQGVIAHEFSHVLNGDMRMSIRMIGVLHGILLLGLVGQMVVRVMFHTGATIDSRRGSDESSSSGAGAAVAILLIGVALIALGAVGSFVGGLLKAAVSRQREYLADASAVQFTRNPSGIAGALKRIGGGRAGSRVRHPRAGELSHMYFAQGVWEGFTSLMATHPPIGARIRKLDPAWDGEFLAPVGPAGVASEGAIEANASSFATNAGDVPMEVVVEADEQVGEPELRHRDYARQLMSEIPAPLAKAAREAFGARAVVYALLLDSDQAVRGNQVAALEECADPVVRVLTEKFAPIAASLDPRLRLPLIDLTLPALVGLSLPQYQRFTRVVRALVAADARLSLFEWTLSRILLRHLRPRFERVRSPRLRWRAIDEVPGAASVALSTLAHEGGGADAFQTAASLVADVRLTLIDREHCTLEALRAALAELAGLPADERRRLVRAAAAAICHDGRVTVREAELLRGFSDLLECPMPPLLAGQSVR